MRTDIGVADSRDFKDLERRGGTLSGEFTHRAEGFDIRTLCERTPETVRMLSALGPGDV